MVLEMDGRMTDVSVPFTDSNFAYPGRRPNPGKTPTSMGKPWWIPWKAWPKKIPLCHGFGPLAVGCEPWVDAEGIDGSAVDLAVNTGVFSEDADSDSVEDTEDANTDQTLNAGEDVGYPFHSLTG
jgi:hypothetical protein